MRIFISHSKNDTSIVSPLVGLIQKSLTLRSSDICCTSLPGYGFGAGYDIIQKMKEEIEKADVVIALLTQNSLKSYYVLFELGGRWILNKHLIPLLSPEVKFDEIKPISGKLAKYININTELMEFLETLAKILNLQLENPSSISNDIEELTKIVELNLRKSIGTSNLLPNELGILQSLVGDIIDEDGEIFKGKLQEIHKLSKRELDRILNNLLKRKLICDHENTHVSITARGIRVLTNVGAILLN